jgi:hypothetical protein
VKAAGLRQAAVPKAGQRRDDPENELALLGGQPVRHEWRTGQYKVRRPVAREEPVMAVGGRLLAADGGRDRLRGNNGRSGGR